MKITYERPLTRRPCETFDEESTLNSFTIATKESTFNSCTDTFDEETFITMSTATKDSTFHGSTVYSPPTLSCDGRDDDEDSYWKYAVNSFTKSYKEFTKAVNELDESAGIKCKETVDTIVDTANWKFPKEQRDAYDEFVDLIEDASAYSDTTCGSMSCNSTFTCGTGYTTACGRSGVTEATGYTTATSVTEATGKTGYTTKSGRSGVTEATGHTTAPNATGLTGPTRERSEKYPSIEIVYRPQVTKKHPTRGCSKLSNVTDEVPAHVDEDDSIFGGPDRSTQRSSMSAKSRATRRSSISDLTLTGRPGRDESYLTSRFGVTWGNAEKVPATIVEDVPIL